MKRIVFFSFLALLFSCDDGDLQVETLDFDSQNIQFCDPVMVGEPSTLFKINDVEAFILELPASAFTNAVTTTDIVINVSESGPARITYRAFSDNVTQSYFCSEIPLSEPVVIDEIIAEGGIVTINTTLSDDEMNLVHDIELSTISLVTSNGSRITNLAINNFGIVVTAVPEGN